MFVKRRATRGLTILTAALILSAGHLLAQNTLRVVSASGSEGGDVTVKVELDTDTDISAAEFRVSFDNAKLTLKEVAKGASAASMLLLDPTVFIVEDDSINTVTGALDITMIDSTFANPVPSGNNREVLLLTFTIASGATGTAAVSLSNASFSNPSAGAVTVATANGEVTIGEAIDVELRVTDAQGQAGANVTISVMADATQDVSAMSFSLVFNQELVTLQSTTRGASAPGSVDSLDVLSDLTTANATGRMDVFLVDFGLVPPDSLTPATPHPLPAGNNREVYKFTFQIGADVADSTMIPLTLSGVELAGIVNDQEVEFTYVVHAGQITVGGEPGDLDGNNRIDIFDLLGLLRVLSGSQPASSLSDLDNNGRTDIFDLLALLRKLAGR